MKSESDNFVFYWWLFISIVSVCNILWYARMVMKSKIKCCDTTRSTGYYDSIMMWLACPYVIACAWRSFWPNCYNERIVYWDVWMSSVFISRAFATVAEVAWIVQVGWSIIRANEDVKILNSARGENQKV